MSDSYRIKRWLPPVLWGILILVLSLMPGAPGNLNFLGIPYFDKIGHFGMYAVWTFLFFQALRGNPKRSAQKFIWITIGIGTLTGILLEYGQYYMQQGRSFEVVDMVANATGSLIGVWVGTMYFRRNNFI